MGDEMGSNRFSRCGWGAPARASLAFFAMALGACASGQWTVVNLHPTGATLSNGFRVGGGQQVGYVEKPGSGHASLWTGTAASWVSLLPAGLTFSFASGGDGSQQVGFVEDVSGDEHASLWSGTAASWVDLHPAGATFSFAFGVDAGLQVGSIETGGLRRASLWTGTASSWVDLHPVGATQSEALNIDGGRQVGYAIVGGEFRASLWTGSAASWTDLTPAGLTDCVATDVDGIVQVGTTDILGVPRACLWRGTAGSFVDLHPPAAAWSAAYGVGGGMQVGEAFVGGFRHASLWSGTAGSWTDLHALLPSNFTWSVASGISQDGPTTHVVGYGFNGNTGREEALLWSGVGLLSNRSPQAVPDVLSTGVATPVTFDPAANDQDPDGDLLTVVSITQPDNGIAVLNANGTVTYTPPAGFRGQARFTYTIDDGHGGTDEGTIRVNVH